MVSVGTDRPALMSQIAQLNPLDLLHQAEWVHHYYLYLEYDMKSITFSEIVATAYGAEAWAPVLTKDLDAKSWIQGMLGQHVVTRNGHEMSLVRDTLFKSQMAMSNIALALRAATELGIMPYTQAVGHVRRTHDTIEAMSLAFAAQRKENHRELVVAEVALKVKEGCFGELSGESNWYTEEELLESGYDYEQIEEILEAQQAASDAYRGGETDDAMSADEGVLRTALHRPAQLWDLEFKDIEWAEAIAAKVALIGKAWPSSHASWDAVLDRLAESWASALDYAEPGDKEALQAKIERRTLALSNLHEKPMYARWAINHVTRRVWRDIQSLKMTKQRFEENLERLDRQAYAEERFNVPSTVTRVGMGEKQEEDRVQYLPFGDIVEAELVNSQMAWEDRMLEVNDPDSGIAPQVGRDRRWYMAVIEECDRQVAMITPLYGELRKLDLSLTKLWELFDNEGQMPVAPPVYWNKHGAYLTEEEAQNALLVEQAEWKAKNRMADDDAALAAAEYVQTLLNNL